VKPTRRHLLHALLASAGTVWPGWRRRDTAAARPGPPAGGALPAPDLEDLVALAAVLATGRSASPGEGDDVREHVESRLRQGTGAYLAHYRTAIDVLERLAGGRFSSLAIADRVALLARHRLGSSRVLPEEELGPWPEDVRVLRTRIVPDLIAAFYRSRGGWAVVGYPAFPGRCGDLSAYTTPPPAPGP
jgi:hypothetical protein